jgi:hypothetical protein
VEWSQRFAEPNKNLDMLLISEKKQNNFSCLTPSFFDSIKLKTLLLFISIDLTPTFLFALPHFHCMLYRKESVLAGKWLSPLQSATHSSSNAHRVVDQRYFPR